MSQKSNKPFYKKWWFWLIVGFVVIGSISTAGKSNDTDTSSNKTAKQEVTTKAKTSANSTTKAATNTATKAATEAVPTEYKNALKKAQQYNDTMYLSKKGLYDQLTSEYGEKFPAEAAQYAIDHVNADYDKNALKKAQQYQTTMSMSTAAIKDQLTSEYGEQFTSDQADYAISHLN